jgi:hypothetical protein
MAEACHFGWGRTSRDWLLVTFWKLDGNNFYRKMKNKYRVKYLDEGEEIPALKESEV